ncbi:MAG: hypothetical protein AB7F78_06990 [Hyphomicrobiaceae bacterium]
MRGRKTGGRQAGTPNRTTNEVKDLARAHGPAAIEAVAALAGLVVDEATRQPIGMATSEQARLAALQIILDRAYGKAAQPLTGDPEEPLQSNLVVEWVIVEPRVDGPPLRTPIARSPVHCRE